MDADTLEQIIDFTYTGRLRITAANVQSTMEAANFLQLYSIVDECCKFLQCRLHSQNVLGIRSFAMTLGCVSLVLSAGKILLVLFHFLCYLIFNLFILFSDRFIHKHFLSVSQGEEYLMLKFDEISTILSREELLVDNEQQIFEAAMRWLSYDPERSKYSAQLIISCSEFVICEEN